METDSPKELSVLFGSDLKDQKQMIWNIETNSINFDEAFRAEMLESPELSLDISFKYIPSFDGTLIPIRIVSKKDSRLVNAPIYMDAYGGFAVGSYLFPARDPLVLELLKRGGVYVGAGIRGGNEFGESWHRAAVRENKFKTYEDLAAVAKSLIDSGITTKNKIAISGISNGGLTVAATGLLYSQYFGLIIAGNGVLDLLDKENLDARFNGWKNEYGDSRTADATYLAKISPLENIDRAENGAKFLIINGRKDSRVNPAHSIKFAKAAADLRLIGKKVDVEMISLNNSGHHPEAPDNDHIGIRAEVIKWSRIYDEFGISF